MLAGRRRSVLHIFHVMIARQKHLDRMGDPVSTIEKDYQQAVEWAEEDMTLNPASATACAERPPPRSAAICSSRRAGDARRSTRRRDQGSTPRCDRFGCWPRLTSSGPPSRTPKVAVPATSSAPR